MVGRLRTRLLLALVVTSSACAAQVCDARTGVPMQMRVQLTFDDKAPDAAPGSVSSQNDPSHRGDAVGNQRSHDFAPMQIQVQLQDPGGGTLQEQIPTSDGQVRMSVCRKSSYRLRITGPAIEEAVLDDVHPGSGDSLVTVVLHRKLNGKEQQQVQNATISQHSLRIPKNAQKQLEKGDATLKKGKLQQAEEHYTRAVALYPQFEQAQNSLGVVLMQEGKKAEGKVAFERALAINHDYAPAEVNLAKIAFDEKRYDDAYVLVRRALKTEPLNTGALFVAAESSFFKRDYAEVVSYTHTLHSLPHGQYALAHFLAGKSLEAQQQPQAAIAEYQIFLEEDPSDPNAQRARELVTLLQATAGTAPTTQPR
jgi:Tfp pilus assembly protein PilF